MHQRIEKYQKTLKNFDDERAKVTHALSSCFGVGNVSGEYKLLRFVSSVVKTEFAPDLLTGSCPHG